MKAAPHTDDGTLVCRRLYEWEELPAEMRTHVVAVDPLWTWVAARDGKIVAALLCGPYQGCIFIGELVATEGAGKFWLRRLLRTAAMDCWERGYRAFLTFLDDEETCHKLRSIVKRAKATAHDGQFNGSVFSGTIGGFI